MLSRSFFLLPIFCTTLLLSISKEKMVHTVPLLYSYTDTTEPKSITGTSNESEDQVFETVDIEASFPGELSGWRQYLIQNLNPNTPILKGAPAGTYTVIVQFIVSRDGSLSSIKALTKHGYGMEAEVMRILRKSPKWIPAQQLGKFVNAYRKQPITFVVQEEKKKKGRS